MLEWLHHPAEKAGLVPGVLCLEAFEKTQQARVLSRSVNGLGTPDSYKRPDPARDAAYFSG
jgi:hypothetical protein